MDSQALTPTPATAAQSALPLVPESWPSAWGLYKYSKQAIMRNWAVLLCLVVAYVVITNIPDLFLSKTASNAVGALLGIPLGITFTSAYLTAVRGEKISFGGALKAGLDPMLCLKYLGYTILIGIALFGTLLLFIVPFFIIMPRLILAPYFVVDKKLGPIKALNASWEVTKGHVGKIWGVIGACVAMALLGVILVGFYFLFMYGAAIALLYVFLNRAQPAAAVAAPASDSSQSQAVTPPAQ